MNSHLRKRGLHVDNVQTELSDGRNLLALMEIVGSTDLPKAARGNMRVRIRANRALVTHARQIHKVENVGKALTYINSKVKLVSIGPEGAPASWLWRLSQHAQRSWTKTSR